MVVCPHGHAIQLKCRICRPRSRGTSRLWHYCITVRGPRGQFQNVAGGGAKTKTAVMKNLQIFWNAGTVLDGLKYGRLGKAIGRKNRKELIALLEGTP